MLLLLEELDRDELGSRLSQGRDRDRRGAMAHAELEHRAADASAPKQLVVAREQQRGVERKHAREPIERRAVIGEERHGMPLRRGRTTTLRKPVSWPPSPPASPRPSLAEPKRECAGPLPAVCRGGMQW